MATWASGPAAAAPSAWSAIGSGSTRTWAPESEESFALPEHDGGGPNPGHVYYRADERPARGDDPGLSHGVRRWHPAIHMPRCLSRITLEITKLDVEPLQAIREVDARAEGVDTKLLGVHAFALLWDTINGDRAPWLSNPWVWVVSFKRIRR